MFSLQQFIAECLTLIEGDNPAEAVKALMTESLKDPEAIRENLASLRPPDFPGDVVFFRSSSLFVLDSWIPSGITTPPHDHGMWAVVGVFGGQEDNVFYQRQGGTLVEVGRQSLKPKDVVLLDPAVIHSISNPLDEPALGIHVYGGDLLAVDRQMWNPFTKEEMSFDPAQFMAFVQDLSAQAGQPVGSGKPPSTVKTSLPSEVD